MEEYIFPFHDVNDLHINIDHNERLSFDQFDSLRFSAVNAHSAYRSDNSLDEIDQQINSQIDSVICNCEYYDAQKFKSIQNCNSFSLLFSNINSLNANFESYLLSYLSDSSFMPKIFAFCETKCAPGSEQLYSIPGYNSIFRNKTFNSGGLAFFIDNKLSFKVLEEVSFMYEHLESLFIEVSNHSECDVVGVIYRRPRSNVDDFLRDYRMVLERLGSRKKIYICGDFNLNLIHYEINNSVRSFVDLCFEFSYMPLINKPSRVSMHSATAIDHIWHNRLDSTLKCGILMSDTSDHFSPFVISSGSIDDAEVEDSFFVYRCWKNMESEEFYDYVSGSIYEYTHNSNLDNIDVSVDRLVCILQNALDKFCPMIKVKCSRDKDKQKPWLTDEIRSLIKEKNRLHNKYLKRPLTFGQQYKNVRNRLNNLKKYTKKNYFCNLLINSQSNCKKTWEVINLILNRQNSKQGCTKIIQNNTTLTDKNEIAEAFNNYFTNVAVKISSDLPRTDVDYRDFLCDFNFSDTFFLPPLTPNAIKEITLGLKLTGGGHLEIPAKMFKIVLDLIAVPLCDIFNKCIEISYFPDLFKIARVVPIFKCNDPLLLNNYRPISLLSVFSKIFEKHLCKHMSNYLTQKKILCEQQCGFISGLSTDISIAKLLKHVHEGLDTRKYGICVFLDLRKAFDLVNKEILLTKLNTYGIRGSTNQLIRSYLDNRQQYVSVNGICSSTSLIEIGVPQGSNMGPLLFLIFINDLVKSSTVLNFNLFADDTSIYLSDLDENNLFNVMNVELAKVCNWILANRLALNIDKTVYLLFAGKKSVSNSNEIYMFNNAISRKNETKFLGLLIDDKLSWKSHTNYIHSKVSKLIGLLFRVSDCFTKTALKTLYYSFIYPHLLYGVIFWGSVAKRNFESIFRLQKRAVRILTKSQKYAHTDPLFEDKEILKLSTILRFEMCKFIHRDLHCNNIFDLASVSSVHSYNTRFNNNISLTRVRTSLAAKFVLHEGVKLYNNLPNELKCIDALLKFKRTLKAYFLTN